MQYKNLKIIYTNGNLIPHGIRDEGGYLLMFPDMTRYPGQDKRYTKELNERIALSENILNLLKGNMQNLKAKIKINFEIKTINYDLDLDFDNEKLEIKTNQGVFFKGTLGGFMDMMYDEPIVHYKAKEFITVHAKIKSIIEEFELRLRNIAYTNQ